LEKRRVALSWRAQVWISLALCGIAFSGVSAANFENGRSNVQLTGYEVPGVPSGLLAGPDGAIWFNLGRERLGRIAPDGTLSEISLTESIRPWSGTVGRDRAFWYTESGLNSLARVSMSGTVTRLPLGSANGRPGAITNDSHGGLWFTYGSADYCGHGSIGRLSVDGLVSLLPIPETLGRLRETGDQVSRSIAVGDDSVVWFTQLLDRRIGRVTNDGQFTGFNLPTGVVNDAFSIATGTEGSMWLAEAGAIGRIAADGHFTEYVLPGQDAERVAHSIIKGSSGAVWFTTDLYVMRDGRGTRGGHRIGRLTEDGLFTEIAIPNESVDAGLHSVLESSDGTVWFTEPAARRIWRAAPGRQGWDHGAIPLPAKGPVRLDDGPGRRDFTCERS
jgi:virginiamycin B lyase